MSYRAPAPVARNEAPGRGRGRAQTGTGEARAARPGHSPVDLPEVSRDASISAQTALPSSWVCVPQRSETRSTM
ncbi:hypothetical protein Snoj_31670 [Streptomyces nojiriensis]|uniref:Uncharacterized protein n=1 Tax=Streptomyces nojiriensis TaxID=66374 RepID=A0ABQ3SM93_9ACTN|nr:hypothetical protein GCM10010205_53850 [Streptomyces nojiriensis]GHI69249.1 hypothetical protein Snoj_31670 [Streptomyces nojiriensis]